MPNSQAGAQGCDDGSLDVAALRPAALRAARLAKLLLGAREADVALIQGDRVWRGRDDMEAYTEDPFVKAMALFGEDLVWVEDVRGDPRLGANPRIAASGFLFYAGAPIVLADGRRLGVLRAADDRPHPYDAALASGLKDLAALVAADCDRLLDSRRLEQMRREADQARQALASFVEAAPSTTVMTDREHRILQGSPSWKYDLGLGAVEVIGASLYDIFPGLKERFGAELDRSLAGAMVRLPPILVRLGAERRKAWAQIEMAPWREPDGAIGGLIIMTQEITAMIEAQAAAEAANRAKTAFLATMSHEIRTPLNGVLGMAQAMAADDLTDAQRDRITIIRRSGEALLGILNDILDLAKIEAGKLELEAAPFVLSETAQGACATFTALAEERGLTLDLDIAPDALGVYRGDVGRFRQVLCNLVSNALKFTDRGGVCVRLRREADQLTLSVVDTGIGIPQEDQQRLFGSFVQVDPSATRRHGGTGLGLSICRQLVEMMGGELSLASAPGLGSAFTARFAMPWTGPEAAVEAQTAPTDEGEGRAVRVLAAEDNAVNQLVLRTLLQQAGVDPTIVGDGAAAVEAWAAEAWDVILMDVQMPLMDGVAAATEIRRREAMLGRARTPIIALTANAMSYQVAEYRACGMDAIVAKPIEVEQMLTTIQQVLDDAAGFERPAAA